MNMPPPCAHPSSQGFNSVVKEPPSVDGMLSSTPPPPSAASVKGATMRDPRKFSLCRKAYDSDSDDDDFGARRLKASLPKDDERIKINPSEQAAVAWAFAESFQREMISMSAEDGGIEAFLKKSLGDDAETQLAIFFPSLDNQSSREGVKEYCRDLDEAFKGQHPVVKSDFECAKTYMLFRLMQKLERQEAENKKLKADNQCLHNVVKDLCHTHDDSHVKDLMERKHAGGSVGTASWTDW